MALDCFVHYLSICPHRAVSPDNTVKHREREKEKKTLACRSRTEAATEGDVRRSVSTGCLLVFPFDREDSSEAADGTMPLLSGCHLCLPGGKDYNSSTADLNILHAHTHIQYSIIKELKRTLEKWDL